MIVISDTSPLNYLVLIQAIDVLPRLFKEIHAPTAVMQELSHPRTPAPVKQWAMSPPTWLHVAAPGAIPMFAALLDPGEAAALALAEQIGASAILIDERKGRRIANERGFTTLGTVTILELAAQHGMIELPRAFQLLSATSFQISKAILDAALARDAAQRRGGHGKA